LHVCKSLFLVSNGDRLLAKLSVSLERKQVVAKLVFAASICLR